MWTFARKRNPSKAYYDNEAFDGCLSQAWILLRHLYAQVLVQLFLDENVNIGIEIFRIDQMMKCGTDWVSLGIIFVQSQIQTISVHFAIQQTLINAGNTAIANLVIEQKVEVSVCDGIQIIIISKTVWVTNLNFVVWLSQEKLELLKYIYSVKLTLKLLSYNYANTKLFLVKKTILIDYWK